MKSVLLVHGTSPEDLCSEVKHHLSYQKSDMRKTASSSRLHFKFQTMIHESELSLTLSPLTPTLGAHQVPTETLRFKSSLCRLQSASLAPPRDSVQREDLPRQPSASSLADSQGSKSTTQASPWHSQDLGPAKLPVAKRSSQVNTFP